MKVCNLILCIVVILTLLLNAPLLMRLERNSYRMATSWQDGFRGTSETVDTPRRMAALAKANNKTIAYYRLSQKGLLPIERSRLLTMSWETLPHSIMSGTLQDVLGFDAIVAAEYDPIIERELTSCGYRVEKSSGGVNLWVTGEKWTTEALPTKHKWIVEFLSVVAFIVFIICCYFLCRSEGVVIAMTSLSGLMFLTSSLFCHVSVILSLLLATLVLCSLFKVRSLGSTLVQITRCSFVVTVLLIIIYLTFALSHTFIAPNGLGTVGGKAKLIFLSSGLPENFFTDSIFAIFQPAYPPGACALILWCYSLFNYCGEWIIQLVPCFLMALLACYLVSRCGGAFSALVIFAVFMTPISLRLATLFYPEGFVGICCLVGWERIRAKNDDYLGWIIIGVAGWFKNEGLIYFCSLALAVLMMTPRKEIRKLLTRIALALVLPLVWHLGCRWCGASLDGYLPLGVMRYSQLIEAFKIAIEYMFCSPWLYAFIYPLSFIALILPHWRSRNLITIMMSVIFSVIAFAFVFSLSDAINFEWHLMSLERLLWVPSLMLLRETLPHIPVGSLPRPCTNNFAIMRS